MSESPSDDDLRAVTNCGSITLAFSDRGIDARAMATELLAARRELAELKQSCGRLSADLGLFVECNGNQRQQIAELTAERDALRAKLAALDAEPRAWKDGDEAIVAHYGITGERLLQHVWASNPPPYALCRILRIPISAAAPEAPRPPRVFDVGDRVHHVTFGGGAVVERTSNGPILYAVRFDVEDETARWWWKREDLVHEPQPAAAPESAPAEKAGEWVPKVGDRVTSSGGLLRGVLGAITGGGQLAEIRTDEGRYLGTWSLADLRSPALAPAPPPEPVETDDGLTAYQRLCGVKSKQPEPPAEGADVNQLRFIAALGADGDVPVHSLSSMMSLNRARTHRCMAVEIARRRLAEMDAAKPAEGAGETLRQAVNKRHGWPVERHISDARVPWCETGADIGRFRAALRRVAYESDDFDSRVIALDALLGDGGGR